MRIGSQRQLPGDQVVDRSARVGQPPAQPDVARSAEIAAPTENASPASEPPRAALSPPEVATPPATPTATPAEETAGSTEAAVEVELPAAPTDEPPVAAPAAASVNLRALSGDIEQELAAALGDLSLDQLMEAPSGEGELELDSRRVGRVVKTDQEYVFVHLGGQHEGALAILMLDDVPEIGSEIEVILSGYNPADGLYELSVPGGAVAVADWSDIDEGVVVEARVTGANKGGLECVVNNIRGFIPASQVALHHVEDLEEFVDQKLACVVTEANPSRRNLVLSHRAVLERQREADREQLMESLEVGQIREGVVRRLQDFGAFVDLGGVDGLIHVSQLSWDRVKHPSEVLKEGERVKVRVEKIDRDNGRIGLSYRETQDNPWTDVERKYAPGSVVKGVVSRLATFGAFVKLEPGVEGLVHISELAHHRVVQARNVVSEGQEVEVKVLDVEPRERRISLSLKQAIAAPEPTADEAAQPEPDEPPRELAVKRPRGPLRGGVGRSSGGEDFGLNW